MSKHSAALTKKATVFRRSNIDEGIRRILRVEEAGMLDFACDITIRDPTNHSPNRDLVVTQCRKHLSFLRYPFFLLLLRDSLAKCVYPALSL